MKSRLIQRRINRRIEMDTTIVSAKNYDEALTKALIELGTTSDNVDVKVKEEGSAGFLGIFGAKAWVLEVSIKKSVKEDSTKIKREKVVEKPKPAKAPVEKKGVKTPEVVTENHEVKSDVKTEVDEYTEYYGEEEYDASKKHILTNDELEEIRNTGNEFLEKFFKAMDLPAHAVYNFSFKTNELSVVIESDEDLGVLIGKRGQTLDSLQYILSLVINKKSESFIRIKLDTENYRKKRKEKLELLARNIASKVKKTGKFTELEPMNAYERRIIHSALQGDNMVSTKSVGEEPFRHITIYPKRNYKAYKKGSKRENEKFLNDTDL